MSKARLLLFDIDGTLLRAGRLSVDAYAAAFEDIFEEAWSIRDVPCAGRTDPLIVASVLKVHRPELNHHTYKERVFERFISHMEDAVRKGIRSEIIEGAEETLAYCEQEEAFCLGLLTGNLRAGAHLKLRSASLDKYFSWGAFGSDAPDRNHLGPVALSRAEKYCGRSFAPEDVYVIGDTVYDIQCARAAGFRSIAVMTGSVQKEALEAEGPDWLLPKLSPDFFADLLTGEDLREAADLCT